MKIPKVARYNYCCHKANEFLINENITKLPFDADEIIKKYKWAKLKYSDLATIHNVSIEDIIEAYDSEDGYSIFTGTNYTIAYNDTISTKERIYFTKLHEIGHIYLGHFIDFKETILKRCDMTESQYKVLENEANCFARNVLVPVTLIDEFNIKRATHLSSIFKITLPASKARLDLLKNDLYYFKDKDTENQKKIFYSFINKKQCLNCGHSFISKKAKYCPVCGHNRLVWGDGTMIYDDGFELDDNGKAFVCPRCGNEQILNDGLYCRICNTYLINQCSNESGYRTGDNKWIEPCSHIAEGNARYCEYCGSRTTFYNQGLLKDWQVAKGEKEEAEAQAASAIEPYYDGDIPF